MPSFRTHPSDHADLRFSTNPIIERIQSQWLFSPRELKRSPSILDGMPLTQEQANRTKGVNFIIQVGILLKLPQLTLATASVYLHRFFMRHSMVDRPNRPGFHHYSVAATALFLATKVEENCRKMRELVVACCRVAQKQPNLVVDEQSKEYWKWRDTILHNEDLLLEALCFDLQIEQPYRILYDFLCYYKVQENKHLRNTSWAFLNDSHITTMCLLFSPKTIAGAALYAGARWAELGFPDDEEGRPWWEQLGVDIFEIQQACSLMAEVYENASLPRKNQEAYFKDEDTTAPEKTRSAALFGEMMSPAGSLGADSQGVKRDREEFDRDSQDPLNGTLAAEDEPADTRPGTHLNGPTSRSPKRLRRETSNSNTSSRLPPHPSLPPRPPSNANGIDEVQQRIDDIINASQQGNVHPPLSRRTSNQQPWRGPPPGRRSSSPSNRGRPHSSHSNGAPGLSDRRSPSDKRPNHDSYRSNAYQRPRPSAPEHGETVQLPDHQYFRPAAPSDTYVDDSEKVDYGSEEGEL